MKITFKTVFLFVVLASTLILTSCEFDDGIRTEEDELEELEEYISNLSKDYEVQQTDLGTYYVVHEQGEGDLPLPYDSLFVQYVGFFTDGSVFDSSVNMPDSTWSLLLFDPAKPIIEGFEDGLLMMNKGAVYNLYIPSSLAYGDGGGFFPPYQTIIFSVKMIDIKHN